MARFADANARRLVRAFDVKHLPSPMKAAADACAVTTTRGSIASERSGEATGLGDGALGAEFGRHVGAADQMHAASGRLEQRMQRAQRLLARTIDHQAY